MNIERRKPPPENEAPDIYDLNGSQIERAGPQPIGFQIQPTEDR